MPRNPIKPHQQQILDAFDAGEKNCAALAKRFDYTRAGVNALLRRYGRKPQSRSESLKATWTPERRQAHGAWLREVFAKHKAAA
jgi:hypothetical protein